MTGTFVVIGIAAWIAAARIPPLIRKGWRKEAALYFAVLVLGTASSAAAMSLARVPSPLNAMVAIYKPLGDWISHWFLIMEGKA